MLTRMVTELNLKHQAETTRNAALLALWYITTASTGKNEVNIQNSYREMVVIRLLYTCISIDVLMKMIILS